MSDNKNNYAISKSTVIVDKVMSGIIVTGGISIIIAVLGICLFIFMEIFPLISSAEVEEVKSVALEKTYSEIALDEWTERPGLIDESGISFLNLRSDKVEETILFKKPDSGQISAISYNQQRQVIILGTSEGQFSIAKLTYERVLNGNIDENGKSLSDVASSIEQSEFFDIASGKQISSISIGSSDEVQLIAAITKTGEETETHYATLRQETSLFGDSSELRIGENASLKSLSAKKALKIIVSNQGDAIIASNDDGSIDVFRIEGEELKLYQSFTAFEDKTVPVAMNYIFGDATILFSHKDGHSIAYSFYFQKDKNKRLFALTKEDLPALEAGAEVYAKSLRNKSYLIAQNNQIQLCFATNQKLNWSDLLPYQIKTAVISGKYNSFLIQDKELKLHVFKLKDPHPDSSLKTFFGKIWYEGQDKADYIWESSGATDEAEPKLSMVPLVFGSIKGTFYALLFAIPIALLSAIYVSQFMKSSTKAIIKPVVEIMASLPSVVIGFLGALWLAPRLESKIPSIICIMLAIPATAVLFGYIWSKMPVTLRVKIKAGHEFIFFAPLMIISTYFAWSLGPMLQEQFFSFTAENGDKIHDFRLWYTQVTGLSYEQKNSLIVGFSMGFAVIPIIFTISEDSLSNVPQSLTSASLALGASRWQTTYRIVLPTASAGIFSACMIGLGRAVGETMIVLFCAGGTAITEWNVFNGMRTLSVNLATELPEAPVASTLYRALYLGAFLLFVMTFVINTFAEVLRQHIRKKYESN